MKTLKIIAISLIILGIVFDYYLDADANIPIAVGEKRLSDGSRIFLEIS